MISKLFANDIEEYFIKHINARSELSVFLRLLIHSTKKEGIVSIDFPGNDDSQRSGWDGFLNVKNCTAWIPDGVSGWEFGTNKNIKSKADKDYKKSLDENDIENRKNITFVFVTPKRWPGKNKWVEAKKALQEWKDVRVYDSSDLEQWLEQSVDAQVWLAERTKKLFYGIRTLDKCWQDWAVVTKPHLTESLFSTAVRVWTQKINDFLEQDDGTVLKIEADSYDEALAFLFTAFKDNEQIKFNTFVFDKEGDFSQIAQIDKYFIAVAYSRNVEKELAIEPDIKKIIIYPHQAINVTPDIILEPIGYREFESSLTEMGVSCDEIEELSHSSGRSLTVLRRRLATLPAIRTPEWARENALVKKIIPFVFLGTWNERNAKDKELLSSFCGKKYQIIEEDIISLLEINDPPIWRIGSHVGLISKIDAMFSIGKNITGDTLVHFFKIAKEILIEEDPSFALSPEERLYDDLINKDKTLYSNELRESIAETLVMLAVYGKNLLSNCIDVECEYEVSRLVREILDPISLIKFESYTKELYFYAEAAPNTFLNIIERDLATENSKIKQLFRPAKIGLLEKCPRIGILNAFEKLAWVPDVFVKVVNILAQLSQIKINDNYANTPLRSLRNIFHTRKPQTFVGHKDRVKVLTKLFQNFNMVAWNICINQLSSLPDFNSKFRWRKDSCGYSEDILSDEDFNKNLKDIKFLILNRSEYSTDMICDLISRFYFFSEEEQNIIWTIIKDWYNKGVDDCSLFKVKEKIRSFFIPTYRFKDLDNDKHFKQQETARIIYNGLKFSDPENDFLWLFNYPLAGGIINKPKSIILSNYIDCDKYINDLKINAIKNIFKNKGISGIFGFADKANSCKDIGSCLSKILNDNKLLTEFILNCVSSLSKKTLYRDLLIGLFDKTSSEKLNEIYHVMSEFLSEDDLVNLLLTFPYCRSTWKLVFLLQEQKRNFYWKTVCPSFFIRTIEEKEESVRYLLIARRPWAAFENIVWGIESIDPKLVQQVLLQMLLSESDLPKCHCLEDYKVENAISLINESDKISLEDKAMLEFMYIYFLAYPAGIKELNKINNLSKYIEKFPHFYVQAIEVCFNQDINGNDKQISTNCCNKRSAYLYLLECLDYIPGQNEENIKFQYEILNNWVTKVRNECLSHNLEYYCDYFIGYILAHSSCGKDNIWPNESVRNVIEDTKSLRLAYGAVVNTCNLRGAHWFTGNGQKEKQIADTYYKWANALRFTHPFVAQNLLTPLMKEYLREASDNDLNGKLERRFL